MESDYFFFVFLSAWGVIQVAASYSRFEGLLLIPRSKASALIGLAAALWAFFWFFTSADRNLPSGKGAIEGAEQFWLFIAAAASAIAITLVLSSILNARMGRDARSIRDGLDALRETTYFRALAHSLAKIQRVWRR